MGSFYSQWNLRILDKLRHISYPLFGGCPLLGCFIIRSFNKGFAEVTDDRINRGTGYGLEMPLLFLDPSLTLIE